LISSIDPDDDPFAPLPPVSELLPFSRRPATALMATSAPRRGGMDTVSFAG
jgi:hypothetical protein